MTWRGTQARMWDSPPLTTPQNKGGPFPHIFLSWWLQGFLRPVGSLTGMPTAPALSPVLPFFLVLLVLSPPPFPCSHSLVLLHFHSLFSLRDFLPSSLFWNIFVLFQVYGFGPRHRKEGRGRVTSLYWRRLVET